MPKAWTVRALPEVQASIEQGAKTIELRIQTDRNRWLIEQMLRYRPGDRLTFQFAQGKHVATRIIAPTMVKSLGELTDEEVRKIVGLLELKKDELIRVMSDLYHTKIDDQTHGYLASFEMNISRVADDR